MSASIDPFVRLMVVCDRMASDPANPRKTNLFGVASTVLVGAEAEFPVRQARLTVFLLLARGRGSGKAQLAIVAADTDATVFLGAPHPISFGTDPLLVGGSVFTLLDCEFLKPGLYWVEFRYNGRMLARQPIEVKVRPS